MYSPSASSGRTIHQPLPPMQTNREANMTDKEKSLQKVVDGKVDNRKVFGTSFSIKKDDFVWHGNSGNFSVNDSYFIASTTNYLQRQSSSN
jgi:hypothetical protein